MQNQFGRVAAGILGALALVAGASSVAAGGARIETAPAEPSGEPIVLGVVNTDTTSGSLKSTADGLQAWVDHQNANGGLLGRPIEIERCDDAGDVQKAADCARRMVDNPDVLAVAGSTGRQIGPVAVPIFDAAGMPFFCASPSHQDELNAQTGFCIQAGFSVAFTAVLANWVSEGIESVAIVGSDSPAGQSTVGLIETALADIAGIDVTNVAFISQTQADYLPAAQAAMAEEPEAILLALAPTVTLQILQAFQTAGNTIPLGAISSSANAEVIASPAAEGLYLDSPYPPFDSDEPGMVTYRGAMEASGYGNEIDTYSLGGWLTGEVFAAAVESIDGEVTREAVLDAVLNGTFDGIDLLPDGLSRANAPSSLPNLGAVANSSTHVVQVHDGTLEVVADYTLP